MEEPVPSKSTETPGEDVSKLFAVGLRAFGVNTLFTVPEFFATTTAKAFLREGGKCLSLRSEVSCAFAAISSSYFQDGVGVCFVSGGPGFLNCIQAIFHSYLNRIPFILVTTSAPPLGFQSLDEISVWNSLLPTPPDSVTKLKSPFRLDNEANLPYVLRSAFVAAYSYPPGPVYIQLPTPVLQTVLPQHFASRVERLLKKLGSDPKEQIFGPKIPQESLDQIASKISSSSRPLLVLGSAFILDENLIEVFVEHFQMPFVLLADALTLLPNSNRFNVSASKGSAFKNADLIIFVGCSADWRTAFCRPPKFRQDVEIMEISPTPSVESRSRVSRASISLETDPQEFLSRLPSMTAAVSPSTWISEMHEVHRSRTSSSKLQIPDQASTTPHMKFLEAFSVIRQALLSLHHAKPSLLQLTVAEGANTLDFARRILPHVNRSSFIDVGVWGTMGMGLGLAIGAAAKDRPEEEKIVFCFEGDSAFGFNNMDYETMVRHQLPIVLFILNNEGCYGQHGDQEQRALTSLTKTDHTKIMSAVKGEAFTCRNQKELQAVLSKILPKEFSSFEGPVLIDILIDPEDGATGGSLGSASSILK